MSKLERLAGAIQQLSNNTLGASQPTSILFGTVESATPLKVRIEQKLILEESFLILTRNVKDYNVEMTVDGIRRTYTIHNALQAGERVILIRQQGGQKYVVLDRE